MYLSTFLLLSRKESQALPTPPTSGKRLQCVSVRTAKMSVPLSNKNFVTLESLYSR